MTKYAATALALSVVLALILACGESAPTEPSVTTIQRASPPVPVPAPADWIETGGTLEDLPPIEKGAELALLNGCTGCHSADGSKLTGPTWQGIFGSSERLEGGQSATVDAAYITESIREPGLKVVEGFGPTSAMPAFAPETLSDEDISAIIAYIESLQ